MAETPTRRRGKPKQTGSYSHPTADALLRPDVGTQAQFRKKKPPVSYRYDSSLSPELEWDGQNPAREQGEALIRQILEAETLEEAQDAAVKLKALSRAFLNWAGKAERLSFDVPTLPLFIHERLSTKAIIETLKGHKRDRQLTMFDLYGDREHPIHEQVLRAYEHRNGWVNRMILGDSLVVMNSLLEYEGLGGQVQMIYMDPPYGIKFGSNFQPFVRKRDVTHNDDEDMTREPEMVKAYRDTWELGLHSYLTYLRDRLLLARELLTGSGSIFVQISDENLHHVKEVMDEVFGADQFAGLISFVTTSSQTSSDIGSVTDYLLWYARDQTKMKYIQLYLPKDPKATGGWGFNHLELPDGTRRALTAEERRGEHPLPSDARLYTLGDLTSQGATESGTTFFEFNGRRYHAGARSHWKTTMEGMHRLAERRRIEGSTNQIRYVRFFDDFAVQPVSNLWTDTTQAGFVDAKIYAVQTVAKVVQRCMLMTTAPGDLVLDPTCGGGTTAYVAEQWGRRWLTIDTSRVPLALTRQRLLTATFPFYQLRDEGRGPAGGFVYERKQNSKGEEAGGIVPHITLKSIANNEPPAEEVLVDRPEEDRKVTRVTGPFCFEATIPTPVDWEGDGKEDSGTAGESHGSFVDRMLEVLRRSPVLHVGGGKTVLLKNVRPPAKTLSLSAEAIIENGEDRPVAIVFGPESGAISEKLVYEAAREAAAKRFTHLYVVGFAIQPNARKLVEDCDLVVGIPAMYVQATPDLMMGDLLKNMRSSQIFSVCGLPEVRVRKLGAEKKEDGVPQYAVELVGLDTFDPVTMDNDHRAGNDVPCWLLDTDYNGLCFHVSQAFFPRTAAWDALRRSLRGEFEDSVWEHLAGTTSTPFEAGEHGQVAVKVIDDRGNELLVVKSLTEAEG